MVMPASGTFDYIAIVPERSGDTDFECRGDLRERIVTTGDDLWDSRLVGLAPLIRVTDAGLTPDAGPQRPWVMRSMVSADAVFRTLDPDFRFPELPLEVSVSSSRSILYGGRRTIEDYLVFVMHGFLDGIPGTDAYGAIHRQGQCSDIAAQASATLMDGPAALSIYRWGE